eukprot:12353879-Ditylum_brightwellii.AAC.1
MSTKPAGKKKFYCNMHGHNRTHDTEDCFELKWYAKCAKPNTSRNKVDMVSYKGLNAFVNAKRKEKEVKLNAFNKFCTMNVENSDEEDESNKHGPVDVDNNDSSASCLVSNNSDSNVK